MSMLTVTDEAGSRHQLQRKLGAGGQGEVWLSDSGRRIVKLLRTGKHLEAIRRQIAFVRRLDLSGLHVAKPIALLKPPHIGYVAEFLNDMTSLESLLAPPASGLSRWYIDSGGMRRRLRLLAHAGEAVMGLHARGVIYSDLSPRNVFVSAPVTNEEAWLIDLDNLCFESDPARAVYSPGYGAPEIVSRTHGCTTLSDAYSFAVLVWRTLTLSHPFIGDAVDRGSPDLEEQALAGQLPWTGHTTDQRNACSTGLPSSLVTGSQLQKLATRAFEDGLHNRMQRPGIAEWVQRLHEAADRCVVCDSCEATYFVTEKACPWCGAAAPHVTQVRIGRWEPGHGLANPRSDRLALTERGLVLTRRTTEALVGVRSREPHADLRYAEQGRGVHVSVHSGREAWVAPAINAPAEFLKVTDRGRTIPIHGWMILFEDPTRPQRVALVGGKQ